MIGDLIFKIYVMMNWRIFAATALTGFLIWGVGKFSNSFDKDPNLSTQEKINTFVFIPIAILVIAFIVGLVYSHLK